MGDFISRTPSLNLVLPQFGDLWPHYHYNNFLFPMSCSKQIKPCIVQCTQFRYDDLNATKN